jgi:hypothetical protein
LRGGQSRPAAPKVNKQFFGGNLVATIGGLGQLFSTGRKVRRQ